LVAAAAAQSTATIAGTIRDQNGDVVVGAEVRTLNIASGGSRMCLTDQVGKYEITGLHPGSYRVAVSSQGFATGSRVVALRRGSQVVTDFTLVPGIVESSISITPGKGNLRIVAETPQPITTVDAAQIEERRPASTLQAIERAPNLSPVIANPALERPRLRGLTSNRLLIILDGDRLNNARSDPTSGVSPSVIDVTQIDSAEVVSGAGSSLYGSDAMAGIINLITLSPIRGDHARIFGFRLDGDLHGNGLFRRGAASLNWSDSAFAVRLSGSLFRESDYHGGNQAVALSDVVRFGKLATDMGNAVGNSVARTFAVWSLPAGGTIPNGQGHGFNSQLDAWLFTKHEQSLRYRQLNSQHKDLGFAFIAPPYDQRTQFNGFRRLDKNGLRYEGREWRKWLPRVAASFYRQKFSFPDDTITSPIVLGSSWKLAPDPNAPQNLLSVLTGGRSAFTDANLSDNKNSITTYAADAQATLAPFKGALITTGVGYLRDSSADEFARTDFAPGTRNPIATISSRASNPNSIYRNWGWFNLLEYEPARWLRMTGGLRLDGWKTEARVTPGFPLGVESTLLDVSFAQLLANPGPVDAAGAAGIVNLVKGTQGIATNRTVVTGNAGFVVRWRAGINPYLRWGNSYREPGITERYLLRDFGDPTFSVLVIPNTALRPERGQTYDAGVKVQRANFNASLGYFRNDLKDFIRSVFAPPLFVPADPAHGLNPISPFFPFHGVLYVQRTNTARARIQGIEGTYEVSLPLGRAGVITPLGSLGWLKGTNSTPDENTLKLITQFYNRAGTPVALRGLSSDVPLSGIAPFRAINGVRYDSRRRQWWGEYELRYEAKVTRVDPLDLATTISTQYGSLASLDSFARQSLRAGHTINRRSYRLTLTGGVENLTNRLYFEHFQTAPAPGRSVVFGMTVDFFDLRAK
jgi:hemoglobin/transferrin/lactoferrin receptor protein